MIMISVVCALDVCHLDRTECVVSGLYSAHYRVFYPFYFCISSPDTQCMFHPLHDPTHEIEVDGK